MRAAAGDVAPAVGAADLPDVTPQQGADLVALAQTAMTDYLHARTAPSSVKIPPQLRELGWRPNAVAVTLRRGGSVMAVEVHSDGDLCMNLIIAALQAMRSPKLPDRVDDKVLAGLTVEVEVLGKPLPITGDQVDRAVVPGLTGLQCGSGSSTVHVLPSAAYVLGLSPEQMLRGARLRLQRAAEPQSPSAAAGGQPAVFAARHYVGYPGSPAFELYRGKLSPAPPVMDDKAALAAAASIGRYLAAHQEADGWFTVGDGEMPLVGQLYVTWALGRLAARQPSPALAECVKRALSAAGRKIVRSQGRAVVKADSPDDTLAATAFLALALEMDRTKQAVELRRELLAGLAESPTAPASQPQVATQTQPTIPPRQVYRGRYIALLALTAEAAYAQAVAPARQVLRMARPADAEAALWAFRAGAAESWPPEFGEPNPSVGLTLQGPAGPTDNRGGFSTGAQPPRTDITGLAAACMEQLLTRQSGIPPATASSLARQLAEARGFCANMIYQPKEAYFAADPNTWAGAVRATPGSAAATAPACAAAIEALIAADPRSRS
jgi:AMMECR1 domain-containing protein